MSTQATPDANGIREPRTRRCARPQRVTKRLTSLLVCVLCLVQLTLCTQTAGIAPALNARVVPGKSKLLKHDRIRLIEALAQKKSTVTLLIASLERQNEVVVSEITSLNGKVQYRDDDVDYLRVELPTRNVEKLSSSWAIESINLAGKIDYLGYPDDDTVTTPTRSSTEVAAPNRDTPRENPYLPSGAIGAPKFIASHPTFDGRGVVVAIIDTNIDLLTPELRWAKNIDGTPVPKFADIFCAAPNAIEQIDDDSQIAGYLRVDMRSEVTASDRRLRYQERYYVVPNDGRYHIGAFDERATNSSGDLNRDGNPAGGNGLFAVLWNESANTVWVDTNQNLDFADEKPMTDYRARRDIGIFGSDDPQTAVRETVGFTVQIDARHESIFIIPGYGPHGTGVAGAAFGANFFGGKIDGVAPAAQIVSIPAGRGSRITAAFIEAVILAMKDPRVDLVSIQFGNFIPQNDGKSTFSIVCDRLIMKYQKLIFAAAGNSTDDLNAIVSPADAKEVIAVGSYISKETSRVNYGVDLADADHVNGYSSHGPTKEGGLKPNILAPTISLTTRPGFLAGENRYGTYPLPPGYQVYGGTSTSSPFAAAGAALLISAAKQSGVKYDPERLRWAIMSSARFLPNYSAEIQGTGLVQVQAAWEALKNAPEPIKIISRAPVKAVLSEYLQEPDEGVGIFEREGWTARQSGQRSLTFTRTSGPAGPMNVLLRWKGNDGTFTSPPQITLPLNTAVQVKISIAPVTTGVHSALLDLVALNGSVVHQVMNTIVAADQLDTKNGFTVTHDDQAEWLRSQSYFVNVPAGTPVLRVDVRIAQGNVMPSLSRPNGRVYYSLPPDQVPVRYTRYQSAGTWSRVVSNPDPGVWQITIDNCNSLEKPRGTGRASFTVTAALLGVAIHARDSRSDLSFDWNQAKEITYSNPYGSFVGEIAESALASAFTANVTFTSSKRQEYEIDVAPGASRVGAAITGHENSPADLDLYLFDCTARECVLRDFSTRKGSSEQVAVDSPAAGTWKVIIDPFIVPSLGTKYQYKDYLLHPAFGRINAQSDRAPVKQGAVVTQRINLKVNAVPVGKRYIEAILFVTSRPGANTDDPKSTEKLYYDDKAILGTAYLQIKPTATHSAAQ